MRIELTARSSAVRRGRAAAGEPSVRLSAVRRLFEVSARMAAGRSLAETLQAVVDGVVDGIGFGIAVLNLRLPDGKFEVIAVAGSPAAKEALLGTISSADVFDAEFAIADRWGGLRFVPHERLPTDGDVVGWVPDVPIPADPGAWHPLDALFAPLCAPDGELLGMLSVDLPEDQRRPGPIHRELLEIFATQAGLAIDKARLTDELLAEKAALKAAELELAHDAAHDPLTGLPNRRLLQARFDLALSRTQVSGRPGALLFCDLNNFKQVNDRYGHEAGDRALKEIAHRLQAAVRHGDTVVRLGGDEFAVLAEDITPQALTTLVTRLTTAVAAPLPDIPVPVTTSIGTAHLTPRTTDLTTLLHTADQAMYTTKRRAEAEPPG